MLNDIEDAFRALKTDLGLRPIYHQTTDKISGHVSISVLAYNILHTICYHLMTHGINDSWQTTLSKLSTHYCITNLLQRKNESPIHIRKSTRANPTQLAIYNACNIPSTILKPTITTINLGQDNFFIFGDFNKDILKSYRYRIDCCSKKFLIIDSSHSFGVESM